MESIFSIYQSKEILIYCSLLALIIGACAGSFLHCMAWRIVHQESVFKGRSHCAVCNHTLGIVDLIPVVSWLFLKGKCRYCGKKIGVRYFLSEIILAAVALVTLLRFDLTPVCARNLLFLFCLFGLSMVDLEEMIIPNGFLLAAIVIWTIFLPFMGDQIFDVLMNIVSAGLYFGSFLAISLVLDRILGRDSLGGGDIKLFGVMGLYLGFIQSIFAIILACILGLVFGIFYQKISSSQDRAFPFGPAIALASYVMLLFGNRFAEWYLSLL